MCWRCPSWHWTSPRGWSGSHVRVSPTQQSLCSTGFALRSTTNNRQWGTHAVQQPRLSSSSVLIPAFYLPSSWLKWIWEVWASTNNTDVKREWDIWLNQPPFKITIYKSRCFSPVYNPVLSVLSTWRAVTPPTPAHTQSFLGFQTHKGHEGWWPSSRLESSRGHDTAPMRPQTWARALSLQTKTKILTKNTNITLWK